MSLAWALMMRVEASISLYRWKRHNLEPAHHIGLSWEVNKSTLECSLYRSNCQMNSTVSERRSPCNYSMRLRKLTTCNLRPPLLVCVCVYPKPSRTDWPAGADELQAVVSYSTWALETQLKSFAGQALSNWSKASCTSFPFPTP